MNQVALFVAVFYPFNLGLELIPFSKYTVDVRLLRLRRLPELRGHLTIMILIFAFAPAHRAQI